MTFQQPVKWSSIFEHVFDFGEPAEATAVGEILLPISAAEMAAVVAGLRNPWPTSDPRHFAYQPLDPSTWTLPQTRIPKVYIDFLAWSDGASWQTGEREFSCFGCKKIREYMLHYYFPEYMPCALPIGLDGGSVFGVFDLRNGPSDAVWAIGCGALSWEGAVKVAESFVGFCRGTTAISEIYCKSLAAKRPTT
jgi:hypothetical protein